MLASVDGGRRAIPRALIQSPQTESSAMMPCPGCSMSPSLDVRIEPSSEARPDRYALSSRTMSCVNAGVGNPSRTSDDRTRVASSSFSLPAVESFELRLCARRTWGQPVRCGIFTISLARTIKTSRSRKASFISALLFVASMDMFLMIASGVSQMADLSTHQCLQTCFAVPCYLVDSRHRLVPRPCRSRHL